MIAPVTTFPPPPALPPPAAPTPVSRARKTSLIVAVVAALGLAAAGVVAMLVFRPQSHRIEGHSMEPTLLDGDGYFVLGDNRANSSDSRDWGPVAARFLRKRFVYVWWRTPRGPIRPPAPGRPSR